MTTARRDAGAIPVLSVYQPWASSMFLPGGHAKPVENRGRRWNYRGPVWIHAARHWDPAGITSPLVAAAWKRAEAGAVPSPADRRVPDGAVIGQVTLAACHPSEEPWEPLCDPWAVRGQFHLELTDPRPLGRPVAVRGQRGIWYLPPGVEETCRALLGLPAGRPA